MKPIFFFLTLITVLSILFSDQGLAATNEKPQKAGKVTFVKGEVSCGTEGNLRPVKAGMEIAFDEILITGPEAKVKLMLDSSKTLVTILGSTKVRITSQGATLLEGSPKSLILKNMDFLRPDPTLDERSTQMGGTFVMRGEGQKIEPLNLGETSIRETRPVFKWKASTNGSFLVKLSVLKQGGELIKLWEMQTSENSLAFPAQQAELSGGNIYHWEISDLTAKGSEAVSSARFYVLSPAEIKAFNKELARLTGTIKGETDDELTFELLKIELLKKYHLNDELRALAKELLRKNPQDDNLKTWLENL